LKKNKNYKLNALVVEDNLINQRLIQILLQGYNISVVTASNGIEATRDIKQNMNINKLTPIIALTAMAMEGDKEMLMESGLDDYMAKPLTRDKLEDMLNKYLKTRA